MKPRLFILLAMLVISTIISLRADELGEYYPGSITVCFSSELIGNSRGDFNIRVEEGIVVTPFEWFNNLAREYEISSLERKYWVKDQEWNLDGKYPMNVFRVKTENHSRSNELLNRLSSDPNVLFAEQEAIVRFSSFIPDDPNISQQWHLARVQAFEAWDLQTGSEEIVIGIPDTGVKWNHPDLRANMWINEAELPGIDINWDTGVISGGDGLDNDGNGRVDDVMGWNFSVSALSPANNPFQTGAGANHGTHVAGIAAAVGNNGIGVAGLAYSSKILMSKHTPFNSSSQAASDTWGGIYYLADSGVNIISCSWGATGSAETSRLAVNYARNRGIFVVAGAGNDNRNLNTSAFYPASTPGVFTVAATNQSDTRSLFSGNNASNFGDVVDVSAPGTLIHSTAFNSQGIDNYVNQSGTSMAAPLVAGVAALALSQNPDLSLDELATILRMGTNPIDHLNPGYENRLGTGRINAFSVVQLATPFDYDMALNNISGHTTVIQNSVATFTISTRNHGLIPAQGYTINLMQEGNPTPLATVNGVNIPYLEAHNFTIEWTANISGRLLLYGEVIWEADENSNNNRTDIHVINVLPEGLDAITVGNPTSTDAYNYTFINYNFARSITQTIYHEDELIPGDIYQMTVRFFGAEFGTVQSLIDIDIYMANSDQSTFSSNSDWVPFDQFTKVFSGNLAVTRVGTYDVEIFLEQPYRHTGGNLVVMATKNHAESYDETNSFQFTHLPEQNRTIYWRNFLPGAINTNPFPNATGRLDGISNARFHIRSLPNPPRNLEAKFELGAVALTWQEPTSDTINKRAIGKYNIYRDDILVDETENLFYADTDIENNAEYTYWVTAVYLNPNLESLPSNTASIKIPVIVEPPTNLNAVLGIESVILTWDAVEISSIEYMNNNFSDDISYKIYREGFFIIETDELTYTDDDIEIDTEYKYGVTAVYDEIESMMTETTIIVPSFNPPLDLKVDGYEDVVDLSWDEPLQQNFGTLLGFRLYRDNSPLEDLIQADVLKFRDDDVVIETEYVYFVKAIWGGVIEGESLPSNSVYVTPITVSGKDELILPLTTELFGNYPNPFNPETTIKFALANSGHVNIEIFNIKGQIVRTLINTSMDRGNHSIVWNGTNDFGHHVGSGLYFYRLSAEEFSSTKRMILLK